MPHTVGRGAARPLRAQNRQRCELRNASVAPIWAPRAPQSLCAGASSVFQLDAFFIRAATGPPRLGEGEPLIRRGKVPLSTTSASPITLSNTPTSPRVSGYVREQSSHSNG